MRVSDVHSRADRTRRWQPSIIAGPGSEVLRRERAPVMSRRYCVDGNRVDALRLAVFIEVLKKSAFPGSFRQTLDDPRERGVVQLDRLRLRRSWRGTGIYWNCL